MPLDPALLTDYDLTVITGTVDRPVLFRKMLASIREHTAPVSWELIVADGSRPPLGKIEADNVTILSDPTRIGFSKALNKCACRARGRWVAWLNDDVEVQPGWADAAIRFMDAHPEVGLGAFYWCDHHPPWKVERAWGILYANFGILSRSLGNRIGWFDEDIRLYGADMALAFRVLQTGKSVSPLPGARILHHRADDAFRTSNETDQSYKRLVSKYNPLLGELTRLSRTLTRPSLPLVVSDQEA